MDTDQFIEAISALQSNRDQISKKYKNEDGDIPDHRLRSYDEEMSWHNEDCRDFIDGIDLDYLISALQP